MERFNCQSKLVRVVLAAAMTLGSLTACTRAAKEDTNTIRLSFPSRGSALSKSLSTSGQLMFVAVNVHLPSGTLVRTFDYHDSSSGAGDFSMEVPNVPRGSFLVQYLGVYEVENAPTQFVYGDAVAKVDAATVEVTITPQPAGSFTREGRVAGRYLNPGATDQGPTGELIMQYSPPAGKPKMDLMKTSIVDGWFSVMVLDGVAMSYLLQPQNQNLFESLQLQPDGSLTIAGAPAGLGNHLARFHVPTHYHREDSGFRRELSRDVFIGYFSPDATRLSGKSVCYPSNIAEAAMGRFTDSLGTNLLDINFAPSAPGTIGPLGGGKSGPADVLFTDTATWCAGDAPSKIRVYPTTLLGNGGDDIAGLKPPFRVLSPFAFHDRYLNTTYVPNGAIGKLVLKWGFLPGITSVQQVAIFAKFDSSGDGGGDYDEGCANLTQRGYTEVGVSSGPSATTFDFLGTPTDTVTSSSRYNFRFALCAFRNTSEGRQYLGDALHGSGSNYEPMHHFGWAPSGQSGAVSSATTLKNFVSPAEDHSARITAVDSTSSDLYTVLSLSNAISAPSNSEVALHIASTGVGTVCGTHQGEALSVGRLAFTRAIYFDSGSFYLKIPKNTFVESLDAPPLGAAAVAGTNFCYVQAVRVPHFRNLSVYANSSLVLGGPLDLAVPGSSAGFMPLRVNGMLDLANASSLTANGSGYKGGTSTLQYAGGSNGPANSSTATGSGGAPGGGGGGFGSGGASSGSSGQGTMNAGLNSRSILIGGGGGGSTVSGGAGGGAIFLMARNITVGLGTMIAANGGHGSGSSPSGSGGGGGGSVSVVIGKLTSSSGDLSILANGGDGGAGSPMGGVGGGGLIEFGQCSSSGAVSLSNIFANIGSYGTPTNSQAGVVRTDPNSDPFSHLCSNLY